MKCTLLVYNFLINTILLLLFFIIFQDGEIGVVRASDTTLDTTIIQVKESKKIVKFAFELLTLRRFFFMKVPFDYIVYRL